MSVYAVIIREEPLHDQAAYDEYRSISGQQPPPAALKPLAVYGNLTPVEGRPADAIALLQFPTLEDAKAWYYESNYKNAAPHRIRSGHYRVMFVEGLPSG